MKFQVACEQQILREENYNHVLWGMMSLKALGGGGGEKKKRGIACLEEDMLIPGTTQFLLSMETVSPLTDI